MRTHPRDLPPPISATEADLPPAVAQALADPSPPTVTSIEAGGYQFTSRSWGDPKRQPLLAIHGVTSSSDTWWRVGPAIAASGRFVLAPDLPGHGRTGGWRGRYRFTETAADVLEFARIAGIDRPDLEVVAHSWGAMIASRLPEAGLRPRVMVLLDPPYLPHGFFEHYVEDPEERPYGTLEEAIAVIEPRNPTWSTGDIRAKAEALTQYEVNAARAVVLENTFDAGLAALAGPAGADVRIWFIRGQAATGSLIPEERVPELVERVGADHVLTIAGGPHSPQRTHPEATVLAILRALEG